jgi:DNA polymerase-3 subunit delta
LGQIISLAKQFPMMSEYHVVIVKEAQNLKELNKRTFEDDDDDDAGPAVKTAPDTLQQLVQYVVKPQPSTILVFCYKYKTLDKRGALYKAIQKHAVFLNSVKLYDNQVQEWINVFIKNKGYSAGPKATFLLAEFLGTDLSKISNEIGKLIISLPVGQEITAEMVQDNIGISKDYNAFELQEALARRDILKANRIINHFAANEKEHPAPMVLGILYLYFTKVLRYHSLADKSKFAAAQAMGVNPFFVEGYARAASNFNSAKLKQIFHHLKEYDLKSKGVDNASVTYGELMKELVYKILH